MKNEAQFLGSFRYGNPETETREITLTTEEWEKIDKLSEMCPSAVHRGNPNYLEWVLQVYIWLCSQDERYTKGIFPTPVKHAKKPPFVENYQASPKQVEST